MLRRIGLPLALSVLPTSAGVLLAVIAAWPTPVTVAAAEVCRKLLAYSLARPARESLYTVLSREEKCELGMWEGVVSWLSVGCRQKSPLLALLVIRKVAQLPQVLLLLRPPWMQTAQSSS